MIYYYNYFYNLLVLKETIFTQHLNFNFFMLNFLYYSLKYYINQKKLFTLYQSFGIVLLPIRTFYFPIFDVFLNGLYI